MLLYAAAGHVKSAAGSETSLYCCVQVQVKDLGGVSVERLKELSDGRFDGTITAFPDDNSDIPMPPGAPKYRRKVRAGACVIAGDVLCVKVRVHQGSTTCFNLPRDGFKRVLGPLAQ